MLVLEQLNYENTYAKNCTMHYRFLIIKAFDDLNFFRIN